MISKMKTAVTGAGAMMLALPVVVSAQFTDPAGNDELRAGGANLANGEDGFVDVMVQILEFLMGLIAVLAILMIVVSGILYMTSGGDEGRIDTAKRWLTYAIVGLVVALIGYVIVTTVSTALSAG